MDSPLSLHVRQTENLIYEEDFERGFVVVSPFAEVCFVFVE